MKSPALDMVYIVGYTKKNHFEKHKKRTVLGVPFERAIETILMPKTNSGNLSAAWDYTDWTRFCIAEQLRRAGELPDDCRAMLPKFYADLDL